MSSSASPKRASGKSARPLDISVWIPLAAIILGIVLRLFIRSSTSLWEDEVIAATHAVQPLLRLLANVIVNDIHPPLYFLELHFWTLLGHSESWLIANSILFGLGALASIFLVVQRLKNTEQALIATAIFALLPVPIWMSGEVRMYALLSVLLIWVYYFIHRAFASPVRSAYSLLAVFILSVAITYTHAAGMVAVFLLGLYAASLLKARRASLQEWLVWLALFGGAGLAAVPLLLGHLIHITDMPSAAGIHEVLAWMAGLVAGTGYAAAPWLFGAGLALYLTVVIAGLAVPATRRLTLYFLIAPIILCGIAELAARPLFKVDFFSTLCSPFLALVAGELLLAAPVKKLVRAFLMTALLAFLMIMAIENRAVLNAANSYYPQAVKTIAEGKRPGDVIWVPQMDIFWGINWYLVGPKWGSPLAIRPPLREGSDWWKIIKMVRSKWVKKLELIPAKQSITAPDGTEIVTGANRRPMGKRLWLVTYPRGDLPKGFKEELGSLYRTGSASIPPLKVDLYESR